MLKNDIASNEYLLITETCCEALERTDGDTLLEWSKSSSEYSSIGIVNYEVAFLSDYRAQLQPPKVVSSLVVEKGMDNIEIVIHASLKTIYQILINVDKRPEWIEGVDTVKHETTYERINMKHNCKFMGMVIINTVINSDFGKDYAVFSERVEMPDADLTFVVHYELFVETDAKTRLNFNANWLGAAIPEENKQGMMQAQAINLENLKKICEKTYFNENKSSP